MMINVMSIIRNASEVLGVPEREVLERIAVTGAAPDLLAALKTLVACEDQFGRAPTKAEWQAARDAITKSKHVPIPGIDE
jgi:hypothetical protein